MYLSMKALLSNRIQRVLIKGNFRLHFKDTDCSFRMQSFIKKGFCSNNDDTKPKDVNQGKQVSLKETYKYIKPYFSNTMKFFYGAIAITVLSKSLISLSPYFLKLTVDSLIAKESLRITLSLLLGFGISKALGSVILELRNALLNRISNDIIIKLTQDMLEYLFKIEYKYLKHNSANIISNFIKSSQGVESLNKVIFGNLIANVVEFAMVSSFIFYFVGLKYFLITAGTYAVYIYATKRIIHKRIPMMQERYRLEVAYDDKLAETVYNIDIVKYFQQEQRESKFNIESLKLLRKQEDKVVNSLIVLNSCQGLIITVGIVACLGFGILDCHSGVCSPGDLVMLQAMFAQIMQPLFFLGTMLKNLAETKVRLNFAVNSIKSKEKLANEPALPLVPYINKGGVLKFENVSFTYNPESSQPNYILKNFNIEFKKGSFNAIVGKSGQGKSTIFNLIVSKIINILFKYKLYKPTSGKILLDDQNLLDLEEESIRKVITICPQNGTLFNNSILYNIEYSLPENNSVSIEDIYLLSQNLNIYDCITSLEKGFDSNAGSLGSKLSGGEKQRVLLARSLIKNAEIIILDEPTSNLDAFNEKAVMSYLMSLRQSKTIIICTHKLNTLSQCDTIFVISNGEVCESGSHNGLLSRSDSQYSMLIKTYFEDSTDKVNS